MSADGSSTTLQVVGNGTIDLAALRARLGIEAARAEFEKLVEDIVHLKYPDVRAVRANPGDWGIDAFVGELTQGGSVMIWQAKYFIDDFGKTQKDDVTESYKSAMKAATEQGYKVDAWTLCIPRTLDGLETTWWTNWKRRRAKDGPVLELMDEGEIRRRLVVPSAAHVRDYYFSPVVVVPTGAASSRTEPAEVRALQELADSSRFDNALFVHQMEVANLPDTRAAREAFFNAEILTQEVEDKALPTELANLSNWRVRVDSTWSNAFNGACQTADGDALPGLFQNVMDAIEQRHHDEAAALRASVVHGIGIMHQRVDDERAGWVRNWQQVAESHGETVGAPETAPAAQSEHHADHAADDEGESDLAPATIPAVDESTTAAQLGADPDA